MRSGKRQEEKKQSILSYRSNPQLTVDIIDIETVIKQTQ